MPFQLIGIYSSGQADEDMSLALPGGWAVGDIAVVAVASRGPSGTYDPIFVGGEAEEVTHIYNSITTGEYLTLTVSVKELEANDDNDAISITAPEGTDMLCAIVQVWRGIADDELLPTVQAYNTAATSGVPNLPAVSTTATGQLILGFVAADNNDSGVGTVAGYTGISPQIIHDESGGQPVTLAGAWAVAGAPGSYDPPAWSSWTSASNYCAITVVFNELVLGGNAKSMFSVF